VVCPITSYLIDSPLFRISLIPYKFSGLTSASQIMIDKIASIKSQKITPEIGELSPSEISIDSPNFILKLSLETKYIMLNE
jgi:mRNA interferase MazF